MLSPQSPGGGGSSFLAPAALLLRCTDLPGLISYLLQRIFSVMVSGGEGVSGAPVFTADLTAGLFWTLAPLMANLTLHPFSVHSLCSFIKCVKHP